MQNQPSKDVFRKRCCEGQIWRAASVHVDSSLVVDENEKTSIQKWCETTDLFDVYELSVVSLEF